MNPTSTRDAPVLPEANSLPSRTAAADLLSRAERERLGLRRVAALLLLALARGALYTFGVPPWQHPDEPTHFEHVRAVAETGRLPDESFVSLPMRREIADSMLRHGFWRGIEQPPLDDRSLSAVGTTPIGIYTYTQPRLYYIVAAVWLRPWLGLPVDVQLYSVRLLSVALNLLVVGAVCLTARRLFPDRPDLALGAAGFVVFQPMHTDIMSAVNNDALGNALAAVFYLFVAQAYDGGWTWRTILLTPVTLAAAVLAKATGLVTVATAPLGLLLYPWRPRSARLALMAALVLFGGAILLAAALMTGALDPLVKESLTAFGRYTRIGVVDTFRALISPESRPQYRSAAAIVFRSFWAAFGWRHVVLANPWYWWPALGAVAAVAGLALLGARYLLRGSGVGSDWRAGYLLFCLAAVIVAWVVAIVRSLAAQGLAGHYLSHGRYAFVAMAPFALVFTVGLLGWLPEAWQRRGVWVFLAAAAAFDAVAFWGYLITYYYFPR